MLARFLVWVQSVLQVCYPSRSPNLYNPSFHPYLPLSQHPHIHRSCVPASPRPRIATSPHRRIAAPPHRRLRINASSHSRISAFPHLRISPSIYSPPPSSITDFMTLMYLQLVYWRRSLELVCKISNTPIFLHFSLALLFSPLCPSYLSPSTSHLILLHLILILLTSLP